MELSETTLPQIAQATLAAVTAMDVPGDMEHPEPAQEIDMQISEPAADTVMADAGMVATTVTPVPVTPRATTSRMTQRRDQGSSWLERPGLSTLSLYTPTASGQSTPAANSKPRQSTPSMLPAPGSNLRSVAYVDHRFPHPSQPGPSTPTSAAHRRWKPQLLDNTSQIQRRGATYNLVEGRPLSSQKRTHWRGGEWKNRRQLPQDGHSRDQCSNIRYSAGPSTRTSDSGDGNDTDGGCNSCTNVTNSTSRCTEDGKQPGLKLDCLLKLKKQLRRKILPPPPVTRTPAALAASESGREKGGGDRGGKAPMLSQKTQRKQDTNQGGNEQGGMEEMGEGVVEAKKDEEGEGMDIEDNEEPMEKKVKKEDQNAEK
ncbi:hypothetical protein BDZ91DRAFT_793028 [Kalaharituber pfeilii]|nr:hypothetical protein BDZ91DRAFT_793028 [Kalaharituber pfeilii]